MADDNASSEQQSPEPNPDMQSLDKLVGTWKVTGGAQGRVSYEWMEGGFFLLQRVELAHNGHLIKGIEIIGHEQKFGEAPSEDIKSRFYDSTGFTFDYVYELKGDTLMIWGGEKGSPAYYKAKFSEDGNIFSGAWVFPGADGYEATSTRIK